MSLGRTRPTRQPIAPIHLPAPHIFISAPVNIIRRFSHVAPQQRLDSDSSVTKRQVPARSAHLGHYLWAVRPVRRCDLDSGLGVSLVGRLSKTGSGTLKHRLMISGRIPIQLFPITSRPTPFQATPLHGGEADRGRQTARNMVIQVKIE